MLVHALFYEIQNIFHELSVFLGSYARSFFPSSFFLLSSNLVAFSSSPGYYPPTHPPLQFGAIVDAAAFGDALRRASSCHHPPSVRLKTLKRVLGIRKHNSQRLMQCPVHWLPVWIPAPRQGRNGCSKQLLPHQFLPAP